MRGEVMEHVLDPGEIRVAQRRTRVFLSRSRRNCWESVDMGQAPKAIARNTLWEVQMTTPLDQPSTTDHQPLHSSRSQTVAAAGLP